MSFGYGAHLSAGFLIDEAMLLPLTRREEEVSRVESRYDQTTGKRLTDVKIVEQKARKIFVLEDVETSSFMEFMEALAEKIRCEVEFFYDQSRGTKAAILAPSLLEKTDGQDFGDVDIDGFARCADVVDLMPRFEILGQTLRRLGVEVGPPMIGIRWTIM